MSSTTGRSGADLGQRLASLSPDRIRALVNKLGHGAGPTAARPRMTRRPGGRYPLSSAQERMWFLCQLAADPSVFNNPGVLRARISTPFERELLEQSLNITVRRHEILRTTFHSEEGRPVQVVHDELPLTVGWDDLRGLPSDRQAEEALRLAYAEGRQPFDLATGPLIAMRVLRLSDSEYLLLVTSHHIVSDGWSNAMFSKEVSATYHALVQGRPAPPAAELQYLDYVAWEQEWMQSDQCREQLAWWKAQLSREAPPLPLPADRPRPTVSSRAGGMETVVASPALAAGLRRFSQEERVSLFQTLMAGLMALLHRYTGQETITVGTSTANRNRREFQPVMGLFINTLVIRAEVDGDGPFRQFLHGVHGICQEALRHQELPFEKLIGELNPPRALNLHPVFQVMFVHQNVPEQYEVPGMDLQLVKVDYGTARFDLNLWAEETNDDLRLTLQYSRDLFDVGTVRRMLDHYQGLLRSAIATPDCPVSRLAYFEPESAPVDVDAAAHGVERVGRVESVERVESITRRFEAVAARHPDAPAAEGPHDTLTYRALNAAANRLARHLLSGADASSVGRDIPIGLLVSRSPRSLVGLLGIMKAGSAFLPLDPMQPPARLAALLQDACVRVLVTEASFRGTIDALPAARDLRIVFLDTDAGALAAHDDDDLPTTPGADALAYVIYTSGTSGMPKGVAVEHRNLASYSDAVWRVMQLSAGDRCATVSSLAADLGHTMIFPPLLHGASVIVVPDDMVADAVALSDYLTARPIDALKIVPSHLRALLTSNRAAQLMPRKLLMLGGETSTPDLIARIREVAPACRVINHYGPTETTVGVLTWELPAGSPAEGSPIAGGAPAVPPEGMPLGFPLPGSRVYVLDQHRQPVPPGVPGEIYIGGTNVARGYLARADLTRERFLPSPFVAGDRLYRTGDRAKRRADGAIVFLGRVDRQVKVRGFRVELREIEQVLAAHPAIAQAAVLPPGADDLRQPLAAWIERRPGLPLAAEAIRQFLRVRLASYMIPGEIRIVDALPLTTNGKIDYQALASRDAASCSSSTPSPSLGAVPRDPIELELAHVWREVIGVDRIGLDDNFFDLGGHSLLAAQLMARVHNQFDTHLPLATVFDRGTIRQMADIIRTKAPAAAATPLVTLQPGKPVQRTVPDPTHASRLPLVFVHPAGGQVLCYMPLAQNLGADVPFFGMQAVPRTDDEQEPESVAAMARDYLDALPPIARDRTPLFGGWSMGALVAFEMASRYAQQYGRLPTLAILDQPAPTCSADVSAERPEELEDSQPRDAARLAAFALKASELVGHDLGLTESVLAGQSADAQAALFLERFIAHGLAPEGTTVTQFGGFLRLMLRHNRITAEYRPAVYPGRVVVFRAEHTRGAGAAATALGWQRYATQPVEVIVVPGTHVSMMRAPHVRVLAERLAPYVNLPDATALRTS